MNFLALIRKQDFIDLYKYGYFHINGDMKTMFEGDAESVKNRTDVRSHLFRCANAFDNAFTYLIIYYEKQGPDSSSNRVAIEEIKGVYPLDNASKQELETINKKILISDPLWPDASTELQQHFDLEDSKKGAQNIWKLFGFDTDINEYAQIVPDDIITEYIRLIDENQQPQGKGNIWLYLMSYTRHEFYPEDKLGYFFDATHILYSSATGYEVPNFEGTSHFYFLESLKENGPKESKDIYESIKNSYQIDPNNVGFNNLFEYMNSQCPEGFDFYSVAGLYLAFKHQYREGMKVNPSFFEKGLIQCKTIYGKQFELACYILGLVLGHTGTYDCLYQNIGLAIHKPKEQLEKERLFEEEERKRIEEEQRAEEEREEQRKKEQGSWGSPWRSGRTGGYRSGRKGQTGKDKSGKGTRCVQPSQSGWDSKTIENSVGTDISTGEKNNESVVEHSNPNLENVERQNSQEQVSLDSRMNHPEKEDSSCNQAEVSPLDGETSKDTTLNNESDILAMTSETSQQKKETTKAKKKTGGAKNKKKKSKTQATEPDNQQKLDF